MIQTGLVMWTTENQWRAINSSLMDVAQHSDGVSRSTPKLLFLHQKQNIRAWQQQFKKHWIWNNFWSYPTETSNSNWRGAPELYQFVPKPGHAQEEQTHWNKFQFDWDETENGTLSIHYVPTDKIAADIFTRSLSVSKVETFRIVLMGTDSTQTA